MYFFGCIFPRELISSVINFEGRGIFNIAAFVALIGEGFDVNQKKETGAGWTSLHYLFSKIMYRSLNEESDFTSITTENFEVCLINILIKHGALPLKDATGRTPLMCLNFDSFNSINHEILDMYIDFESSYYNLNKEEYKSKFFKLKNRHLA